MKSLLFKSKFVQTCALLSLAALQACSPTADAQKIKADDIRFIASEDLKNSGFPLSTAVEADAWIFLSGSLGTVAGKGFVERGIEPETRQTMENIKATLGAENLGMNSIVKCTVMLADMAEWPAFNDIYKEFFDENYPARSAFGVNGLAANARVEIECIARR